MDLTELQDSRNLLHRSTWANIIPLVIPMLVGANNQILSLLLGLFLTRAMTVTIPPTQIYANK